MHSHLEHVTLSRGDVLGEPGDRLQVVAFPQTCVISVVQTYSGGDRIEVATIGCEGVVCVFSALGGSGRIQMRHQVQIGGAAVRMPVNEFMRCVETLPRFRTLVHRYISGLLGTTYLSAACNRAHSVEQRLARWLLMTRDRSTQDELPLTHEILAEVLGVHRPTVTVAAGHLVDAGLIAHRRGVVQILDRAGLERASCECYRLGAERLPSGC